MRQMVAIVATLLVLQCAWGQTKKSEPLFEKATEHAAVGQYEEAIRLLNKAIEVDPTYAEAWLVLGQQQMALMQYGEAEESFGRCLKLEPRYKRWREEAEDGLATARWRKEAVAHPVPFRPVNLGPNVNTAAEEYMPALTVDYRTLVFTRRAPRRAETPRGQRDQEDFYISHYDTMELAWGPSERMPEPLNSDMNEGAQTVSHDGRVVIFTACGRSSEPTGCDLYMSVRSGKGWSRPRNLGAPVNSVYWESFPSLSIDGQTLYFASNRSGGYGGTDIWYCQLEDGRWGAPRNMGPTVNTAGDETAPYIHFDNKTLYFASNGHRGMGGSDLFMTTRVDDTTWAEPKNLGYPINTPGDENNLIVAPDGRTALFSSDRADGYGGQDIYSFVMPSELRPGRITYIDPMLQAENLLSLGDTVTLPGIYFATGSDALVETSLAELERLAEALRRHPRQRFEVGGHTDNVGQVADNQKLSERRAKAVYDYLILCGVDPSRLSYKGYGSSHPVADNDTPEGRAKNRRTTLSPMRN